MSSRSWMQKDARLLYIQESSDLAFNNFEKTFAGNTDRLEMFAVIGDYTSDQIRVADRNKYIGSYFYEGRVKLPRLSKDMPDLFSGDLRFSEIKLEVNNLDGKYSNFLPFGGDYRPWIGENVSLYLGRGEHVDSFEEFFRGEVHTEGGVEYDNEVITFNCRDKFDSLNKKVPLPTLNRDTFPNLPEDVVGKPVPFSLGDFSYGFDVFDGGEASTTVFLSGQRVQRNCKVVATEDTFCGGVVGYNVGGGRFVFCIGGNHEGKTYYPQTITECYLARGSYLYELYYSESPLNSGGFWGVDIYGLVQSGTYDVLPYMYEQGDRVILSTKIGCLGNTFFDPSIESNPIYLIKEWLVTMGRLDSTADFDNISLDYLSEHEMIFSKKMRFAVDDLNVDVLGYALSMCKQIFCDLYSDRENKITISHFWANYFPQISEMRTIKQASIIEKTFKPKQDPKNFFTSAQGSYGYNQYGKANAFKTMFYANQTAEDITKKRIDRQIDFPNLYIEDDVLEFLYQYVRFFSSAYENIKFSMSWEGIALSLGDFVKITYTIGGFDLKYDKIGFVEIPVQIRGINVDPEGFKVEIDCVSLCNFEFPSYYPWNRERHLSHSNKLLVQR